MERDIVIKQRVTNTAGSTVCKVQAGIAPNIVETLMHQLRVLDTLLKETDRQYEEFITSKSVDSDYRRIIKFQMKRVAAFVKLSSATARHVAMSTLLAPFISIDVAGVPSLNFQSPTVTE